MSDRTLALARFAQLVGQSEAAFSLTDAALAIAQIADPTLDIAPNLDQLQQWADQIRAEFPDPPYPLKVLQTINRFVYQQWGFQGNNTDYYDPRNSFLNHVLVRRTGIPISLAVVYLDLACRLDFPMVGIGMPGHFLVRPDFEAADIFVDVFNQGAILFPQDCHELLNRVYQRPVPFNHGLLAPVDNRSILVRMLTNLKHIYLNQGNLTEMLWTVDALLILFPDYSPELKVRGLLHFELKQWSQAQADLQDYLVYVQHPEEIRFVQHLLEQIAQHLGQA